MNGPEARPGFLQAKVAARLQTRFTPVLSFKRDDSVKKSIEMSRLIDDALAADRRETRPPTPAADGATRTPTKPPTTATTPTTDRPTTARRRTSADAGPSADTLPNPAPRSRPRSWHHRVKRSS